MGAVWLLAMVAMTIAAVVTAKGAKWKLINLGIIVGLISLGLFTGLAAGLWARNNALGAYIALAIRHGCSPVLEAERHGLRIPAKHWPQATSIESRPWARKS
jgi:hypothetical protein